MEFFYKYFTKESVERFITEVVNNTEPIVIDRFIKYHNQHTLKVFTSLFPPASIFELWDRWCMLPERKKDLYEPNKRKIDDCYTSFL